MPQVQGILATISFLDILDIAIVAYVLYRMYYMIKDTRAVSLLKGLFVLLAATALSKWLELNVINWLLQKTMTVVLVALPVVFQPELRRALEQLGRGKLFRKTALNVEEMEILLDELVEATTTMARNKIGALIVIERETGLSDYIETGVKVDGLVSSEFLINIFIPNTPMHDGAVIIRGNRVMAAACLLPLTEDRSLSKELGTRHRAALGLSEQTDSLIIVVSEETGTISLAMEGGLTRHLDGVGMKKLLRPLIIPQTQTFHEKLRSWRLPS